MPDQTCNRFQIHSIRDKFLGETYKKQDLCHEIDVHRVCIDDWTIERFLLDNKDQHKAYKALVKANHWKKKFGVHDMTDENFVREFFEWGDPELFGQDKEGRYIVWASVRNKCPPFINELNDLIKQTVVYMNERDDKIVHRKGYTMINWLLNTDGLDVRNMKLDMIMFPMELKQYYPFLIRSNIYIDMPKALATTAKWMMALYNKTVKGVQMDIKFISLDQLTEFVDWQLIPAEMGGPRMPNIVVPANAKPLKDFQFSEKTIKKFLDYHYFMMDKINKFEKNNMMKII